jgi:basic membrane protein A
MQDTLDVSGKNPDTIFMHCSGYEQSTNMGNYFGRNYEGAYLAGMAAAGVSKSNLLGYVGSFPIAEVLRNLNAFALGARAVNPKAKVQVVWISAWYDPTLAAEATETLIAAGADAIFHYENSPSVVQTAAKHGVYAIGQHADNQKYSPEYCLTSSLWNWGALYTHVVDQARNGTWKSEGLWWGIKEGLVDIAELNPAVPQDVQDKIKAARDKLKNGDVTGNPFYGEVKDQNGKIRIAAGVDASMDDLFGMDYLVDNVVGKTGTN